MELTLGFPDLGWLVGDIFGQDGQNLHENAEIRVFYAKCSRRGGRQAKYCRGRSKILSWLGGGGWRDLPYYPPRGNTVRHTSLQIKD